MSETQARNVVWIAAAIMLASALVGPNSGSRYRRVWATGIATFILAAAADFAPQIIGPLALGITLVVGTPLLDMILPGTVGGSSGGTASASGGGSPGSSSSPAAPAAGTAPAGTIPTPGHPIFA